MENFKERLHNIFWGYTDGLKPIEIDEKLLDLLRYLNSLDLNYNRHFKKLSLEETISSSKAFWTEHFAVQDVVYLSANSLQEVNDRLTKSELTTNSLLATLKEKGKVISPFAIPIRKRYDNHLIGLQTQAYMTGDFESAALIPVCNLSIGLAYPFKENAPITLTHEIAHTQTGIHKGRSVSNFHYNEVISIFLEKLHAFNTSKEMYQAVEKERLSNTQFLISSLYTPIESRKKDANRMSSYIVSELLAENLFNMYCEASNAGKAYILDYLQVVMNGKLTIEELLEALEIDFERSKSSEFIEANLSL